MSMFRSIVTNVCRGFGCLLAASCTIEMSVITRCPQGVKWLFLKMILIMIMTKRRIEIRNISTGSKETDKTYQSIQCVKTVINGSCKRSVDYLVMVFLNKRSNLRPGSPSSHFICKTRGRGSRINLLYASSARNPESGLLSDWSENKRSFGALHSSVKQHIWLPELLDRFCYLMVTFVSSIHDRNHEMTLKRKPLTAEMRTSCYLLRPVRISAISSPMLSCSRG